MRFVVALALMSAVALGALAFGDGTGGAGRGTQENPKQGLLLPEETKHLSQAQQLTFEGTNAEAYWSPDGQWLVFQSTRPPYQADQIFVMRADGSYPRIVSTGKGRCTCAYFTPDGNGVIFATTHLSGPQPPQLPKLDIPRYAWGVFASYELYLRRLDTMELIRLTDNDGYDAEATICWKTGRIVFTSYRNGDLDLYSMRLDGSDLRRLTTTLGYEGGAFYSPDGKRIVFRAYLPKTPDEIAEYQAVAATGRRQPAEDGVVRHGRRRSECSANHTFGRHQLLPCVAARWQAHHLRQQPP
jgi:TolB protein